MDTNLFLQRQSNHHFTAVLLNWKKASCLVAAIALACGSNLSAQVVWDGGGSDDNFSTPANWVGDVAPVPATTNDFTFTGSTRLTPQIAGGDYNASTILFDAGASAFTINGTSNLSNRFQIGASGLTITQSSAANQVINATILGTVGTRTVNIQGGGAGTLTLSSFRQTTALILNIDRNAIFDDFTSSSAQTRRVNIGTTSNANATFNADPLAGATSGSTVKLGSSANNLDATATFNGAFTTAGQLVIAGGGDSNKNVTLGGNQSASFGSMTFLTDGFASDLTSRTISVNNSSVGGIVVTGNTTLGGTAGTRTMTFDVASGSTIDFQGNVINNGATAVGALVKDGDGSLRLAGTGNNYSGGTTVNASTLIVANATGSATGTGAVSIGSGSILRGTGGNLAGATTISGSLRPGTDSTISTLAIDNNVTWNGGNNWVFNLGAGDTADLLTIDGDFTKGSGSVWNFDFAGSTFEGVFTLIVWTGNTSFASSDFSYSNLGSGLSGSFGISGSSLQFTAIPEPSSAALLMLSAAALIALRRRKRA